MFLALEVDSSSKKNCNSGDIFIGAKIFSSRRAGEGKDCCLKLFP